jgi:acyl-CoA thioesterase FadM
VRALTRRLEVDLLGPAPIGSMAAVRAWVEEDDGRRLTLASELRAEAVGDTVLARAHGAFVRVA